MIKSMICNVPEGQHGDCKIEKFTVSEKYEKFGIMRAAFHNGRYVPQGTYTRLLVKGKLMMSDTPDELKDHLEPVKLARGNCLVAGLGLGCVVQGMLEKGDVGKVIVLEKEEDVAEYVGGFYTKKYGSRLEVRVCDALTYKPPKGETYAVCWYDIWPGISFDNLKDMHLLHRRYGRRTNWQDSWQRRNLLKEKRKQENRSFYW